MTVLDRLSAPREPGPLIREVSDTAAQVVEVRGQPGVPGETRRVRPAPYATRVDDADAARRLALAFDMYETAEAMVRARLRREHPTMNQDDLDAEVRAWRMHRPGAEHGDADGRRSNRFA